MNLESILKTVKETKELLIENGSISRSAELFKKHWPGSMAMLVADSNTWNVAGKSVFSRMEDAGIPLAEPVIYSVPPMLHADYSHVQEIIAAASAASGSSDCILVAVGSGTVNDLVKRASFELGRAYFCIGTAASMDGYCSSGAALVKNGRKQTLECPAPAVILADPEILSTAPLKASAAGFGDLASKITAGADWILADFTGNDPVDQFVWDIVQPNLDRWLSEPEKAGAGDSEALSRVFEGLNFSGLAMQVLGRSRAASGAEHMYSHVWEMNGHTGADGNPVSHGFQVSVGIMCVAALYDEVFKMDSSDIDVAGIRAAYPTPEMRDREVTELMNHLPSWEEYIALNRAKYTPESEIETRLQKIRDNWDSLRSKVRAKLPDYPTMKKMLNAAGCPVKPADINLDRNKAVDTYYNAQCLRNRYTILDLAWELGILNTCVERIRNNPEYL